MSAVKWYKQDVLSQQLFVYLNEENPWLQLR